MFISECVPWKGVQFYRIAQHILGSSTNAFLPTNRTLLQDNIHILAGFLLILQDSHSTNAHLGHYLLHISFSFSARTLFGTCFASLYTSVKLSCMSIWTNQCTVSQLKYVSFPKTLWSTRPILRVSFTGGAASRPCRSRTLWGRPIVVMAAHPHEL